MPKRSTPSTVQLMVAAAARRAPSPNASATTATRTIPSATFTSLAARPAVRPDRRDWDELLPARGRRVLRRAGAAASPLSRQRRLGGKRLRMLRLHVPGDRGVAHAVAVPGDGAEGLLEQSRRRIARRHGPFDDVE